MALRKTERNPLFAGRWFEDDIILLCLRWYFRFKLSYRDLVVILGERGLSIATDVGIQDVRQCATRHYRHRTGAEIHKHQFAIPIPWQSNPSVIWRHVMAA